MATSNRLIVGTLIGVPLILLQQHLRLQSTYPTRRVTPSLEISSRSDAPAVGMNNSQTWLRTHAGDEWIAEVPKNLLVGNGKTPPEVVFARAFWGSWPLKIERKLVHLLVRAKVGPFELRGGGIEGEEARNAEKELKTRCEVARRTGEYSYFNC